MGDASHSLEGLSAEIRRFFAEDPRGVLAVYVFGSRARGTARAASDLDVAVLRERPSPPTFDALPLGLESALERRLGLPVEVIDLATAPADLVHRILRDGRLLVDRAPGHRIAFEVQRRNEYFDLLPILRQYRRAPGSLSR